MKRRMIICAAAAASLPTVGLAQTGAYPNKPIRIVVAWPPGSLIDVMLRILSEPLREILKQPLVIDNKAGATGIIGADIVAGAAPDGYTLLFTSAALNMVTAMGTKQNFKVPESFTPVLNLAWSPMVLVSYPPLGLKTPQDLLALSKARNGNVFFANSGNGSPSHFTAELFRVRTGMQAISVPFKGSPQAMNEQIAGRVDYHFAVSSTALPMVRDGRITALAVTSRNRLPGAPNVPTMEELGIKDFGARYWNGLLAPKGTPAEITEKLAAAINQVLADKDILAKLAPYANEIDGKSTPRSFEALLKEDLDNWAGVVKAANIKPD
ncbi:MAG: tripartite tricarboxylate transporter substrate binding protein [Betaproteobacteria bacterium]